MVSIAGNNEKYQKLAYMEIPAAINYNKFLKHKNKGEKHYEILFYIFDKTLEFEFLNTEQKEYIRRLRNKAIEKRKELK